MEKEKRFEYQGPKFPDPGIRPVSYQPNFFQKEMSLESEAFYELRKANAIHPHRISESSGEELRGIADFFNTNRGTFYFLFSGEELVGSILFLGNYIPCVSVAPRFRRKGYGAKLSMFAVNRILESGHPTVVLHTLPGNVAAERLYAKLGFKETPGQSA
jgi:ribosomal protein S18 acetylase RimI-like enzyme